MHREHGEGVSQVEVWRVDSYYGGLTLVKHISREVFEFRVEELQAVAEERGDFVIAGVVDFTRGDASANLALGPVTGEDEIFGDAPVVGIGFDDMRESGERDGGKGCVHGVHYRPGVVGGEGVVEGDELFEVPDVGVTVFVGGVDERGGVEAGNGRG